MHVAFTLVTLTAIRTAQIRNWGSDAGGASQDQAATALVAEVDEHYSSLPDEEPTVATVEDADAIHEQVFFANASRGDKALVFRGAQLAAIYRQSTGVVVHADSLMVNAADLAPVNLPLQTR